MRGEGFHNHLVGQAERRFVAYGFETATEHRLVLPDGRVNYVDLLARRQGMAIACEVETTARYVAVNVAKARALALPLWVLVPTRAVHRAVLRRLRAEGFDDVKPTPPTAVTDSATKLRGRGQWPSAYIFLFSQLDKALRYGFPPSGTANTTPENKRGNGKEKTNPPGHPGNIPHTNRTEIRP